MSTQSNNYNSNVAVGSGGTFNLPIDVEEEDVTQASKRLKAGRVTERSTGNSFG
jgi:hypothetical protein